MKTETATTTETTTTETVTDQKTKKVLAQIIYRLFEQNNGRVWNVATKAKDGVLTLRALTVDANDSKIIYVEYIDTDGTPKRRAFTSTDAVYTLPEVIECYGLDAVRTLLDMESFTALDKWRDMAHVRAYFSRVGSYWFTKDTMHFFRTRIESKLIAGKYFITSDRNFDDSRVYNLRMAKYSGDCETLHTSDDITEVMDYVAERVRLAKYRPQVTQ